MENGSWKNVVNDQRRQQKNKRPQINEHHVEKKPIIIKREKEKEKLTTKMYW